MAAAKDLEIDRRLADSEARGRTWGPDVMDKES
jgi:hypothetical protein